MIDPQHNSPLERRLNKLLQRIKASGQRVTPQRVAVFTALLESSDHPSAEQIFKKVSEAFPSMSLATVYKTLTLLKQIGEVLELGFGGQESRYDGLLPLPHPHLICTCCGKIVDPPFIDLESATKSMAEQTGYRIDTHRLDFFGICPSCQREAGTAAQRCPC